MRLSMRNRNMADSESKTLYVFFEQWASHGGIQFMNYSKHGTAWWHRLGSGGSKGYQQLPNSTSTSLYNTLTITVEFSILASIL